MTTGRVLSTSGIFSKVRRLLHRVTLGIELLAVVFLIVLGALDFLSFGQALRSSVNLSKPVDAAALLRLLDIVLLLFIIIELLNIAIALIDGRRVIQTVFEAVLVAIARKIIVSGTEPLPLDKASALALIIVAVGSTWWLMARANERSAELLATVETGLEHRRISDDRKQAS